MTPRACLLCVLPSGVRAAVGQGHWVSRRNGWLQLGSPLPPAFRVHTCLHAQCSSQAPAKRAGVADLAAAARGHGGTGRQAAVPAHRLLRALHGRRQPRGSSVLHGGGWRGLACPVHVPSDRWLSGAAHVQGGCRYHSGPPVFHDGGKEWSCCRARSHDFGLFMSLPGCARVHPECRSGLGSNGSARARSLACCARRAASACSDHGRRLTALVSRGAAAVLSLQVRCRQAHAGETAQAGAEPQHAQRCANAVARAAGCGARGGRARPRRLQSLPRGLLLLRPPAGCAPAGVGGAAAEAGGAPLCCSQHARRAA